MTSRAGNPDTAADVELRECLGQATQANFVMVAGAGSGKTTSLVKALEFLAESKGAGLRRRRQKIACITYTEVAANEIWGDVGNNPLLHVSTIHSFLWSIVSPFQADLRTWVTARIDEKIKEAQEHFARPRTRESTRTRLTKDITRYQAQRAAISTVPKFGYGTGSDYMSGVLGHSDILAVGPAFIAKRPLMRTLVARRFPFIFVDESQDTVPQVVEALTSVAASVRDKFCLGFFGDPMQKIYPGGAGKIDAGTDWRTITKPENFRCPSQVLTLVNKIRAEDDGLEQVGGRKVDQDGEKTFVPGSVRLFLLPADEKRTDRLKEVRRWVATANSDPCWETDARDADVRVLVLVHRMAAKRLGFPGLHAALTDGANNSLENGWLDGTSWVLRPFLSCLLPLIASAQAGDNFDVISNLRRNCPRLQPEGLKGNEVSRLLANLRAKVEGLVKLLTMPSTANMRDVLNFVRENELITLDDRFHSFLDTCGCTEDDDAAVVAFLACPATELWNYRTYIERQSPYATHQGIKGAEFERVLVVLDDEEGTHSQFSYGKYFGILPLSGTDNDNIAAGKDSVLDRTRRLFYVCCSRARRDLVVVLFIPDVEKSLPIIRARELFPSENIHTVADLAD